MTIFGRWASHASMELYTEPGNAGLAVKAQQAVLTGTVNAMVGLTTPPRDAVMRRWKAYQAASRMYRGVSN